MISHAASGRGRGEPGGVYGSGWEGVLELSNSESGLWHPTNLLGSVRINGFAQQRSNHAEPCYGKSRYLGTIFKRQPGVSEEINSRITAGNRCIGALNAVLKNKGISRKLKMRIYKTVIRPIVIFGSDVWTLRKEEVQRIEIWERKVLRKIFGGKIQDGRWERRTNREIYDLFKEPNIIGIVRAQRMRWIGHVVRMKDHRIPKMVLIHEIGGGKRL
ncbi:hypothetical protein NQ318_002069 [Aromia moschata]|uniref:Uncharacterized protein n=1 Tax=Aromia moschata TaxID=1265417 RepID=A0AAV8Z201_9CUCU|nr:hypothetical protein NQ318_002069 [Aromia moschata]